MAKDTYEDVKRHRSDDEVNNRRATVWRNGKWSEIAWKDIVVGDICKIENNQPFPADLVLVWSPEPQGVCYVETANLDGETNLKARKSPGALYKLQGSQQPVALAGQIVCETPNNVLERFNGRFEKQDLRVALTADNVLLRGSDLRNTPHIIGIVVFTGADTKLMKNSAAKASKMSHIDRVTNKQIILVFGLLLVLCLICTIAAGVLLSSQSDRWYLPQTDTGANTVLVIVSSFATFLILFNNLIPISLYVTIESVKLILAQFMNNDIAMYHEESDTPALARTSSLCEELGQVEYIFSDKTGTLTCNMMDFLKFTCSSFDGPTERIVSYGTGTTEIGRAAAAREGRVLEDDRPPDFQPVDGLCFYDSRISDNAWLSQPNHAQLEFFFTFIAVCHGVVPEQNEEGGIRYQAASPDEGCLVTAMRNLGVAFVARTENSVTLHVHGEVQVWDIYTVIEFDSARKRMSVICRDPKSRKLMLLCKGADSIIMDKLRAGRDDAKAETQKRLTAFAADGLRTLVLAKVDLDEATYADWAEKYDHASCAIVDRERQMADVAELIETNMELVGATAVEDKLQAGVPASIELLSTAGIKIWVLTGDKQETAINIGFACALLDNQMGFFTFDTCPADKLVQALRMYLDDAKNAPSGQSLALVIQTDKLKLLLPQEDDTEIRVESELFLALATRCRAVICCRVTPLQKAQVVKLVRDHMSAITLAIGDGANDVSMIQAAHVGVGISGLEGLQAARASDYSVAQFRFLQRLLLVHGRMSYRRISKVILFCFYKNVTLFLTQMWFAIFNLVTGQSLYDQWALSGWNVAFTAYPIIALAIFDRDVDPEMLLSTEMFPELYHDGMKDLVFNTTAFWLYTANAIMHSAMIFFVPLFTTEALVTTDGQALGMVGTGITCYTCALLVVTGKATLESQCHTAVNALINVGSVIVWFAFLGVYGNIFAVWKTEAFSLWYGLPRRALVHPVFWMVVFLVLVLCLAREVAWKCWRHYFAQKLGHLVQEFNSRGRKFTRRDVARCSPHLLPPFEALKPYEPRLLGDREGEVRRSLTPHSIRGAARVALSVKDHVGQAVQGQQAPSTSAARVRSGGVYAAQPGAVNIKDIVIDEL